MSEAVSKWLEQLGLGRYADAFAAHAIDEQILPDLSDADLKELGVTALGHRKTILKAIASLPRAPAEAAAAVADGGRPSEPAAGDSGAGLAAWERHPGERKPVTMLFADVTGSTALTEKLDAEEAHALLYGAIQRMCAAVENNRGTVCRFMGDGVMAMFGAPLASEHHAIDACQAALEMQEAIKWSTTRQGPPCRLRREWSRRLSLELSTSPAPHVLSPSIGLTRSRWLPCG
ncbi:MAG: hypothetical protein GWO21_15270 [Gammaproteobacteria bacterium]|nr:hypothetical protein [Gammaproteobacteria bacterium]